MAGKSSNSAEIQIGANTVAKMLSFNVDQGCVIIDDTVIGDAADTHQVGTTNWTAQVECFWDEDDTNGQEAMTIGASVDFSAMPEGDGSTLIDYNGTASVSAINYVIAKNEIIKASFTVTGNGALTRSVLA